MGSDTDYDLITQDNGDPDDIVLVSTNGRYRGLRYHNTECLRAKRIDQTSRITRQEAQKQEFVPCKDCHPSVDGGVYLSPEIADLVERVRESIGDS